MLNVKASMVAQKLLNLYRQEHVIFGGWAAVNQVFLAEASPEVLEALREMPTGRSLVRHIENLRAGKTPLDSIERDLLPYGGAMTESVSTTPMAPAQWRDLEQIIADFTPDQAGLDALEASPVIKKFGAEWLTGIRTALSDRPELQKKWDTIAQTYRAYHLWNTASEILNTPISDRIRAQLQADMPEYETYLPMFGDAGDALLGKLRTFLSSVKTSQTQPSELESAFAESSADVR